MRSLMIQAKQPIQMAMVLAITLMPSLIMQVKLLIQMAMALETV